MTRTKLLILTACVLSMGAGVGVGMLRSRNQPRQDTHASWLANELELTLEQQKGMEVIWKELVKSKGKEFRDQMWALQQEREAAVAGLLSPSQSEQFEQLNRRFMEKGREIWKRAEQEFMAAGEKTRALLNESQRVRYDELVKQFQEQHSSGEWFAMPPMGRGPTTSPAAHH